MSVQVTFTGNAGRDPETRNFSNGGSVTSIPVAVSQGYFDKSNNWVDQCERLKAVGNWHVAAEAVYGS